MAGNVRHWKERNGRYSARVVVPVRLRPYLDGKAEIEIQLGGDKREARKRHSVAVAAIQHQIALAEERHAQATGTPRPAARYPLQPDQLAIRHYLDQIKFDADARKADHRFADTMVDEGTVADLRAGIAGQLDDNALDALVGYRIERFRFLGTTNAVKGSPEWRDLAMKLCVSEYEAMARHFERNEGDFTGKPDHPLLANADEAKDEPSAITTFNDIIDAEAKRRARGKDAKALPAATIKKFRAPAEAFAKFRKSDNAATVTALEGKLWIEAVQDSGAHSNRTIKGWLQNVRTILNWGRQNDPANFMPQGNPLIGVKAPDYSSIPSYLRAFTMDEAKLVLLAARKESKPMFRWIPWLCAYSGMRIAEAGSLTKEDFFQNNGRWFWRVSTIGGKSLKTASSERRIPVHQALIDEGFIEFVKAAPEGRLFRGETKKDVIIQPRLSTWVRELIPFETRPELSPNHGWRHLFEDLCRRDGVPEDARKYMTGRTDGSSQEMYGRSEVMLPGLATAMDRIVAFHLSGQGN